jgi:hypothetical protein
LLDLPPLASVLAHGEQGSADEIVLLLGGFLIGAVAYVILGRAKGESSDDEDEELGDASNDGAALK